MIRYKSLLLKKKYLFLYILLLLAGNGGFSLSMSNFFPEGIIPRSMIIIDKIPFFIKNTNQLTKAYKLNDDIFILFGNRSKLKSNEIHIMSPGRSSIYDMTFFLMKNNPKISYQSARRIATFYYNEAKNEGVNQDIAFSQMCLETGFLTFQGIVHPEQNNFCGLGALNYNIRGEKYPSILCGIRAHIQHLKAYASKEELRYSLVDRRFGFIDRGSATTVDELTGKWATDHRYSEKIRNLLNRLGSHSLD